LSEEGVDTYLANIICAHHHTPFNKKGNSKRKVLC
jgi:hypothetical protein